MIKLTEIRINQKERLSDVTACLADLGKQDQAVYPGVCRPLVGELQKALDFLGRGFALFGLYVSSRIDLLPAADCVVLNLITDRFHPVSFPSIEERFLAEIGRPMEEAFLSIEREPFESRVLYQTHRVGLHNGHQAILKVLRADASKWLAGDMKLLHRLEPIFVQLGWHRDLFTSTVARFEEELARQMDFVGESNALQLFADQIRPDLYQVAKIGTGTSSKSFLTLTVDPEQSLSKVFERLENAGPGGVSVVRRKEIAQALCDGWLRQAFEGGLYPVTPISDHIYTDAATPVVIGGGQFSRLSEVGRDNLWRYITSVAAHDPDMACAHLLAQMPVGRAAEKVLKHLFRQVVPFRDGGWTHLGYLDSLPEHMFLQWQMAIRQGCRPSLEWVQFFRGLFHTAWAAHRLVPDEDAFGQALQSYQAERQKEQFKETFDIENWSDAMDKYAVSLSDFPQKLDGFLNRALTGDFKMRFRLREANEHRLARNTSSLALSLGLLLLTLAMIVNYLSQSINDPTWLQQFGAGAFLLIGGLLLWILNRSKL
jgi:hypothetical protein